MPSYALPPWLQGTNWLAAFSQAASLNQRERQLQVENQLAQQRLEQQMQVAQMNLAATAQRQQENLQRKDAEIAYQSAYHEAMVGLREQELQQNAQMADAKIRQVAAQAAAQLKYGQLRAGGMEALPASIQSNLIQSMTPDAVGRMGMNPQAAIPGIISMDLPGGGKINAIRQPSGHLQAIRPPGDWTQKFQAAQMAKELSQKQALMSSPIASEAQKAGIPDRIKELQSGISNILQNARAPQEQQQDDNERESGKVDEAAMTPDDEDINDFLAMLSEQDPSTLSNEDLNLAIGQPE